MYRPVPASGPPHAVPVATSSNFSPHSSILFPHHSMASSSSSSSSSSSAAAAAAAVSSASAKADSGTDTQGSASHGNSASNAAANSNSAPNLNGSTGSGGSNSHNNHQPLRSPVLHHRPQSGSISSTQEQKVFGSSSSSGSHGNANNGVEVKMGSASPSTTTTALPPPGSVIALAAGSANTKMTKRAIQSCAECKRRKIKCNRVYPCMPCTIRGEQALCREVEKVEPVHMPVPTMTDFEAACSRIQTLEEQMMLLQTYLVNSGPRLPSASNANSPRVTAIDSPHLKALTSANGHFPLSRLAVSAVRNNDESRDLGHVQARTGERDHEDMAMMLEDFAMGHRANRDRVARLMNGDKTSSVAGGPSTSSNKGNTPTSPTRLPGISEILPPLAQPVENKRLALVEASHPLAAMINPDTDYISKFIAQAPDPLRGWQLVQFYFTHLEWYSRVLHAPTFIEECKSLLSLPPSLVSGRVRPSFLATYFMILCLSLQFIEPNERANLGLTAEQAQALCMNMFSAAQALLWMCDFLGAHSLEHLQAICLMGVYQYNVGLADSHWALLGSAIKVAQNLGLSRLGNEFQKLQWPTAWRDPVRREIGRRVWWQLIFLDWSHATAHNGCYSIHPSQNFTNFPSNVDDNDLQEGNPVVSKPMDVHTDTSFTICRLKFVALYRELVDHQTTHNPPSYSYILDMDARVVKLLDSLPPYFRGATPPSDHINDAKVMECLLIQLIGETRLLRLHRPYLSRGYKDRKYAPSKDRCVHSARSILVLLKTAEQACPLLLGQWLVLFYGFGAAVVTFIDLCNGKDVKDEAACRTKRQELRDILALLQRAKNVSDAARSATSLLEGLLAAEEEVALSDQMGPPSNGKKRKADEAEVDPDPFKKVVKKLLADASGSSGRSATSGGFPSPGSSLGGLPGMSPAFNGPNAGAGEDQQQPQQQQQQQQAHQQGLGSSSSSAYALNPAMPPPFQADLDLFLDGARSYTQFSKTGLGEFDGSLDPTSADLSHLFVDDIISNLFAGNDPTLTSADPLINNVW